MKKKIKSKKHKQSKSSKGMNLLPIMDGMQKIKAKDKDLVGYFLRILKFGEEAFDPNLPFFDENGPASSEKTAEIAQKCKETVLEIRKMFSKEEFYSFANAIADFSGAYNLKEQKDLVESQVKVFFETDINQIFDFRIKRATDSYVKFMIEFSDLEKKAALDFFSDLVEAQNSGQSVETVINQYEFLNKSILSEDEKLTKKVIEKMMEVFSDDEIEALIYSFDNLEEVKAYLEKQ